MKNRLLMSGLWIGVTMIWFIYLWQKISPEKRWRIWRIGDADFSYVENEAFSYDGYDLHVHSPLFKNEKYLEEGSVIPAVDIVHRMQTGRYYYKRLWPRMDKDE